ncbi:unnamed protein product [Spirodela intermedia]|uniref:Reverse transcriptase RNase H-like domain-containing protein n=1 Tax=Spirodela intermedia TaxID=51605 RepID=A0A7I8JJ81_SPIIN|nr:unnamed protein product [Spirodela intermedia]CAA6669845.1 unnamed protein product [Spirodela intermedia]
MTALVHCLWVWRHYLLDQHFTIYIDNVATSFFNSQKNYHLNKPFQIIAYIGRLAYCLRLLHDSQSIHYFMSPLKAYNADVDDPKCNWPHHPLLMVQAHYD